MSVAQTQSRPSLKGTVYTDRYDARSTEPFQVAPGNRDLLAPDGGVPQLPYMALPLTITTSHSTGLRLCCTGLHPVKFYLMVRA